MSFPIYEMSSQYYDDDGCFIRRVRRTPHLSIDQLYLFFQKLEIVAEVGLGLDGSATAQGADPQIMVRWSDDGGKKWSNEAWLSMGRIGEFRRRIRLWRMGRSLDRVFEVVITEPTPIRLIDGLVTYSVGKP
jgi:hypothetical protein